MMTENQYVSIFLFAFLQKVVQPLQLPAAYASIPPSALNFFIYFNLILYSQKFLPFAVPTTFE